MKVISGKYKGKKINGFNIDGTRPTMDRIKESLFAMIQDYIKDSIVLDLYSGSGNLGIEAISNGCKKAYLVDINKEAIKIIENNLKSLNINNAYVYNDMANKVLNKLIVENLKFDILFLDPPYDTDEIEKILDIINKNTNRLNKDLLIICETDKCIKYSKYDNLVMYKEKKYGQKYVNILKIKQYVYL